MTDYCVAITALFDEQRKLPRPMKDTDRKERWRINLLHTSIHRQMEELQERATKEFAALNGWRYSERLFSIKTLARGGAHAAQEEHPWELYPPGLLDHPVFFREKSQPYRPAAAIAQPYDTAISVDQATELAHSLGLELHAPPNSVASWWVSRPHSVLLSDTSWCRGPFSTGSNRIRISTR